MSIEKLNKLQNELSELEGYISYLKSKKLSRGLSNYEYRLYDNKKEELELLKSELQAAKKDQQKLTLANV